MDSLLKVSAVEPVIKALAFLKSSQGEEDKLHQFLIMGNKWKCIRTINWLKIVFYINIPILRTITNWLNANVSKNLFAFDTNTLDDVITVSP